uniref:Uncharacterized protein n=1 Tax=Romanomermis culicivorax TaxID=13658 RepID=A0A915IUD9_ROMCU
MLTKDSPMLSKNDYRPFSNRKPDLTPIHLSKANHYVPLQAQKILEKNVISNSLSKFKVISINDKKLWPVPAHTLKVPVRFGMTKTTMEHEIVSASFRMSPRSEQFDNRDLLPADCIPKVDARLRYTNDIEAALNGDADVAGYGEIDDVLEVDSTLDSEDEENENERRQAAACAAPSLDAETERKVKQWIDDPSNQHNAPEFSPPLRNRSIQYRTKNLAAAIAPSLSAHFAQFQNTSSSECILDETLRGPFSRPENPVYLKARDFAFFGSV